jgi:hypothetical protein
VFVMVISVMSVMCVMSEVFVMVISAISIMKIISTKPLVLCIHIHEGIKNHEGGPVK